MAKHDKKEVARAVIAAPTLEAAAGLLGVHRNTLLALRKDPETQKEIRALAAQVYQESINKAMVYAPETIDILKGLATGQFTDYNKVYCQLNAIKLLNEIAKYGADINEIEKRLEALEGVNNG